MDFKNFRMPFKIKSVEPLKITTREERQRIIKKAGYNLFGINSEDVLVDLLTDSGTGAMSSNQWAEIMLGDESYAGATSFRKFRSSIQEVLGFEHIIPTHQGRAAENVVMRALVKRGDIIPGNYHFDTTMAHIEDKGARGPSLIIPEGKKPEVIHPFKGNVDIDALREFITSGDNREKIPFFIHTVTCNSAGGQPVSMENIKKVRALLDEFEIPLFMDIARYAENAFFIKRREKGYEDKSIGEIVLEMMSFADVVMCSAKKDPLGNIGGFIATNKKEYYDKFAIFCILHEGFLSYGGLSGRAMGALSVGIRESIDEAHLGYRIGVVNYLGTRLDELGVPIVKPVGGHAVFIDGLKTMPHIKKEYFPAQALGVALYVEGGVRGVEIGSLLAGRDPDTGEEIYPPMDNLRLAVPRRVYTMEHMDMVVEAMKMVLERKDEYKGFKIVSEAPVLRHFTVQLEKIG